MKSKILSLLLLSVILLSVGMISAASLTINNVVGNELSVYQDVGSFQITFDLINEGEATDINWSNSVINEASAGASFSFSHDSIDEDYTLLNIIATITFDTGYVGTISGTIEADPSGGGDSKTLDFSVEILESLDTPESFCEYGTAGDENLKIKKVKIKNKGDGTDSDDNKWFPLDIIKVEVELENDNNYDIDDIIFELGLFKKGSDTNIIDEMFWISEDDEEFEAGDIEESGESDDELEHTFEFRINPEEVEDGKYYLKIKAYEDGNEEVVCIDHSADLSDSDFGDSEYYAEIDIELEDENDGRAVVVDVYELDLPIEAPCDAEVTLDVDVWNIGDTDQEQVKINLYNEELNIDEDYVIRDDLDQGEEDKIEFSFIIPKDAEEKQYTLEFRTYYDYDDKKDRYKEASETFDAYLKVKGNCVIELPEPQITAELDSETPEAIAGKQVIIKATIKNTGEEATTYLISIFGHSSWSSLSAIDPQTLTLDAGESKDVSIYLDVDDDAEGDKEFTIKATYGEQITEQRIELSVGKGVSLTGAAVGEHIKENWFIYVIVVINIILIIAIIAVVKSMVGRTPATR